MSILSPAKCSDQAISAAVCCLALHVLVEYKSCSADIAKDS